MSLKSTLIDLGILAAAVAAAFGAGFVHGDTTGINSDNVNYDSLLTAVSKGLCSMDDVNTALRRTLKLRCVTARGVFACSSLDTSGFADLSLGCSIPSRPSRCGTSRFRPSTRR